jgi:hypothetical protein
MDGKMNEGNLLNELTFWCAVRPCLKYRRDACAAKTSNRPLRN